MNFKTSKSSYFQNYYSNYLNFFQPWWIIEVFLNDPYFHNSLRPWLTVSTSMILLMKILGYFIFFNFIFFGECMLPPIQCYYMLCQIEPSFVEENKKANSICVKRHLMHALDLLIVLIFKFGPIRWVFARAEFICQTTPGIGTQFLFYAIIHTGFNMLTNFTKILFIFFDSCDSITHL